MPQTLANKGVVPINSDAYNLTPDLATMGNSLNVIIPVANTTVRDALTKFTGMAVARLDLANQQIEVWDGTVWQRNDETGVVNTTDTNWGYNGGLVRVRGTGRTHVQLSLKMNRIGGTVNLAGSYSNFGNFIPSGWYPAVGAFGTVNIHSSLGVFKYQCTVNVSTTGDLLMQPVSGTAQTIVTGDFFILDMGWHY